MFSNIGCTITINVKKPKKDKMEAGDDHDAPGLDPSEDEARERKRR